MIEFIFFLEIQQLIGDYTLRVFYYHINVNDLGKRKKKNFECTFPVTYMEMC